MSLRKVSRFSTKTLISGLIVVCCVLTVHADRIVVPDGIFYYQPASSVFGPEANWNNPATLGKYRPTTYQLMADFSDNNTAKSWGLASSHDGFGFAYRYLHNPDGNSYRELVWSLGLDLGNAFEIGGSYRYFDDAPGAFNNRHFWNLGFAGDIGPLRWGIVLANLNRNHIYGVRTETETRYSLAYRPFGNRLTIAADALMSTKTRLPHADFVYHAEAIVSPGVFVNGYIDSHQNFQFGIRLNLLHHFTGSNSSLNSSGDHQRSTVFFGTTVARQESVIPIKPRRLHVSIRGSVPENPPRPVFGKQRSSFTHLILALYRAANDPSIGEMLLTLENVQIGFGRAQELRQAVEYFQSNGKKVVCHLSDANNLGYYIASTCDRIYMPPVSQLNLVGLRAELTFYGGTLDKIGVNADMIRIGDYKTAPESYTRSASSDAYREQINRLLDDLNDQFVKGIADGRKMTPADVQNLIDQGPWLSTDAIKAGLIDGRMYQNKLIKDELPPMPSVSLTAYFADTLLNDIWPRRPVVAVIVAEGEISEDDGQWPVGASGDLTPGRVGKALRQMKRNPLVEAAVLRVNSPGGFAIAGEKIHHELDKEVESVPLAVSMANIAASGGYYISTPATRLFANSSTVTGSIGIFGGKVDLSGLYDKIDLHKELYTRGEYAGMMTTMRPFTEEERARYRSSLMAFYEHFVDLVAENRSLPRDSIDNLSRGRVWTGRQAFENGLVDEIGGLHAALEYVTIESGIEDYDIRLYPEERPLIVLPGFSTFDAIKSMFSGSGIPSVPRGVSSVVGLEPDGGVFARLPFDLDIQ